MCPSSSRLSEVENGCRIHSAVQSCDASCIAAVGTASRRSGICNPATPSRGFRFRRSCRSRVTQQAEFLESVFSGFAPTGVLLRCGASFRHRSAFIFTTHGTRFRSAQKDDAMITTVGPPMKLTPLLTVREAADVLRISERTLWSLTNAKELPSVRVGRSVRYDQNDLATWIASQKTVS